MYRVRNAGKADAAAFSVRIVAGEEQTPLADQTLPEGLKAGAVKEMSLQAEFEKRPGADAGLRVCIRADAPAGS
ncbi:MAG: CARDB domain-containing protein [Burkholderiales bacterium]